MSLVTISVDRSNPQRVISGTISLPRIGVWHLEVKVDSDVDIAEDVPAVVSVNGGELDLVGTVTRAIEYQGVTQVRVVGGDATIDAATGLRGLQRLGTPAFYQGGADASSILGDLLADSGNELSGTVGRSIAGVPDAAAWTTIRAPIGRQTAELMGGVPWRVLPDGTVWAGAETWPETDIADDDWQTLEYDHWNGIISFGLLSPTLLPGTTIGGYRADRVEMTISGDSVTANVWEPRDDGARIDRDLLALGRGSMRPFDFFALYAGVLKSMDVKGQTFDITPDDDRLPAMSKLKIRNGIPGLKVDVPAGAKMLVGWSGGDPRQPYCATWDGAETPNTLTLNVTHLIIKSGNVELGGDNLVAADAGVVLGACVDPFTGATHFALGGASSIIKAKKG